MVRGTACNEILWIHGWATSANVWQPSIQRITDYHHHVLDFSQCISESDFIQVLRNKLAELNRPVSVVGWSLGGMILLQHLLETSDPLIQRAIIVDATLCFVDRRARLGWPEFVLRRMQANIISGETNQTLVQFFAKMSLPSDVQLRPETDFSTSVLVAGLEYLIQTDLREQWQRQAVEAPEILARIHWIHGTNDAICPPGAVPVEINEHTDWFDEQGHAPMLEDVQRFTTLIGRLCNHGSDAN